MYNKIIESGGLILSEYPMGIKPDSEKFRQRNRIVSGLSVGVLVVEAGYRSGTTITARYAKEQGKQVFCIPSSIDNSKGIGTNTLIKKGAKLVLEPIDILQNYGINTMKKITVEELDKQNKITAMKLNNIKEEYRKIYEKIFIPLSIDEIRKETNLNITEIYSKLFMMELEGLIKKVENKYVII